MTENQGGERGLPISDADITAIVRLIGEVAGMTEPLPQRRRALMAKIAALIEADVWVWVHSAGWEAGTPFVLGGLDGGWIDDDERNRVMHANSSAEWIKNYRAGIKPGTMQTLLFDKSHPGWQGGRLHEQLVRPTGFEHLLFSMFPLRDGVYSGWGLHRRQGRSPYTPREVAIVHLILGQLDWLHEYDTPAVAKDAAAGRLSPRAQEVLFHLLGGDRRKTIARKLGISEHTVNDYFKTLHKTFNVSTRAELMAKFLPGSAAE